jgi:hypothetical protein
MAVRFVGILENFHTTQHTVSKHLGYDYLYDYLFHCLMKFERSILGDGSMPLIAEMTSSSK